MHGKLTSVRRKLLMVRAAWQRALYSSSNSEMNWWACGGPCTATAAAVVVVVVVTLEPADRCLRSRTFISRTYSRACCSSRWYSWYGSFSHRLKCTRGRQGRARSKGLELWVCGFWSIVENPSGTSPARARSKCYSSARILFLSTKSSTGVGNFFSVKGHFQSAIGCGQMSEAVLSQGQFSFLFLWIFYNLSY